MQTAISLQLWLIPTLLKFISVVTLKAWFR